MFIGFCITLPTTSATIWLRISYEDRDVSKILWGLALISFCFAAYFGSREWISYLIFIPLSVLCVSGSDRFGSEVCAIGVILVCFGSIFYINSQTPIWGEVYELRKEIDSAKKISQKETVNLIVTGQNAIKGKLKDPSSAKFSNDFTNYYSGIGYYCGLVDAKNSFGGYSGLTKFVSDGTPSGSYLQDDLSDFNDYWSLRCQ